VDPASGTFVASGHGVSWRPPPAHASWPEARSHPRRRGSSITKELRDVIHRADRLSIEISPGDSDPAEPVAVRESMGGLPRTAGARIALPRSAGTWWLVASVMFSYLLYYFVGLDQGAVSVFGFDMHEFMHDGRHFASFPCH
jgi:hypothetical protein